METSLKIANYKCFRDEYVGFDVIKPINVVVGRNNSGKSALLDIVEFGCSMEREVLLSKDPSAKPDVLFGVELDEEVLKRTFRQNTRQEFISRSFSSDWDYGSNFIGKRMLVEMKFDQVPVGYEEAYKLFSEQVVLNFSLPRDKARYYVDAIASNSTPNIHGKVFRRLLADRDVRPESEANEISMSESGVGVTNAIRKFLNSRNMPSEKVDIELFDGLKEIYAGDAVFEQIMVQYDDNSLWEIFLLESEKGRIPLTGSGSGLKTIISILVLLHLIPHQENIEYANYILAIEEPENNLHPALLRRLLAYLERFVREKNITLFITSHSAVCIDFFQSDIQAQVLHITHDGERSSCNVVQTYVNRNGVLDDLDVRASDLLQSNGIIWVEGPSDRLFVNSWLEIYGDGKYKEGTHYQCMFYGGRLMSHLSGSDPTDDQDELIKLLSVNRNAAVLIDSDKRNRQTPLNETKKRIEAEFVRFEGFVWITKGREIENYLPAAAISKVLGLDVPASQIGQYEDIKDHLEGLKTGEGRRFERAKPEYADRFRAELTKEDLSQSLDLAEKMADLMQHIDRWNGIRED